MMGDMHTDTYILSLFVRACLFFARQQTSKYELWSFMPKFLAMEFHPRKKIANVYFLIVSCMQARKSVGQKVHYFKPWKKSKRWMIVALVKIKKCSAYI